MHKFVIALAVCWIFTSSTASAQVTAPKATVPQTTVPQTTVPKVEMTTDLGVMVLELDAGKAPHTVKNFLGLVERGFYNGVIFHRVIPGFVAQAGGFTFDFQRKPLQPNVVNESGNGLSNTRGTVAMARTSDPDSASTQFYINLSDNPDLDARPGRSGYTVFGRITEGFDVAEKIAQEPRGQNRQFADAPNTPVRILDIKILSAQNDIPEASAPE